MDHDLVFIRKNRGLPAAKQIKPGLCNYPSRVINIDSHGRIFVCLCEAWAPWSAGHVLDFDSMEQVWQSSVPLEIANSQQLGEYSYCDTAYCNVEYQSRTQSAIQLLIGIDDSCQLSCPSCRNEPIFNKDYDIKLPWAQRIVEWLTKHDKIELVNVLIGSHGDPFASGLYRKIISDLAQVPASPLIRFQLKTNGLLLTRYLSDLSILPNLTKLEISIDAATEATYEQVRRPGRWATLLENLEYCLQIRSQYPFHVKANFVVQQANYTEMLGFVELCRKYKMTPDFTLLQDWNTFAYADNAVHLVTHPEYDKFVETINHPALSSVIGKRFDNFTKP